MASATSSDSASDTSSAHATFLGLPPELRVRVYDYTLDCVCLFIRPRATGHVRSNSNATALLRVSRLVRHESQPVFYSTVLFILDTQLTQPKLRAWMNMIGEDAVSSMRFINFVGYNRCEFDYTAEYG